MHAVLLKISIIIYCLLTANTAAFQLQDMMDLQPVNHKKTDELNHICSHWQSGTMQITGSGHRKRGCIAVYGNFTLIIFSLNCEKRVESMNLQGTSFVDQQLHLIIYG